MVTIAIEHVMGVYQIPVIRSMVSVQILLIDNKISIIKDNTKLFYGRKL
jgi:hypothetical protein